MPRQDRLTIKFSDNHNLTVDGANARNVYYSLKQTISSKGVYLEITLDDAKAFLVLIGQVKTAEFAKGDM